MWAPERDDLNASTSTVKKPPVSRASQAVYPMFIKMLNDVVPDLVYYGNPVSMVRFVGLLRKQNRSQTKTDYEFEDFSGMIQCQEWIDKQGDSSKPSLMLNSYYKVIGTLKCTDNHAYCVVIKIIPIKCFEEIIIHNLKAIDFRYDLERRQQKKQADASGVDCSVSAEESGSNPIGNDFQFKVYKEIASVPDVNGIEMNDLKSRVKADPKKIEDAVRYLIDDGHVYTTINENWLKTV